MTRLHPSRARDVIRCLESLGFVQVRQGGSHKFFRHFADGRTAAVPDHRREDLGRGLLAKILGDAQSSREQFLSYLTGRE